MAWKHRLNQHSFNITDPFIQQNPALKDLIGNGSVLSGQLLKQHLEQVKLSSWKQLLDEVFSPQSTSSLEDLSKLFLMICGSSIETDRSDLLKAALSHSDRCRKALKPYNHPIMIMACRKNKLDCVKLLYQSQFRLRSRLEDDFNEKHDEETDSSTTCHIDHDYFYNKHSDMFHELQILGASAKPAYLLARATLFDGDALPGHLDPIAKSFRLLNICQQLNRSLKAHNNKIKEIKTDLCDFQVAMLDLCDGSQQVQSVLAQNDEMDGVLVTDEFGSQTTLPRVRQAICLKNKRFVVHDGCQQKVRETFFSMEYESIMGQSQYHVFLLRRLAYGFLQALLTPLYSVCYMIYASFRMCCCNNIHFETVKNLNEVIPMNDLSDTKENRPTPMRNLARNLEVPYNRMISHTSAYLLFIANLIIVLINPNDTEGTTDLDWYDVTCFISTFGYFVLDIQMMSQHYNTVKKSWCQKLFRCISNKNLNIRLVTHTLLLTGMTLKTQVFFDFRGETIAEYPENHSVRLGVCFMGIGTTMSIISALTIFRLSPSIGPIHLAMQRCIKILLTFFVTFTVITLAFSAGLVYILKYNKEQCHAGTVPMLDIKYNNFTLKTIMLQDFCKDTGLDGCYDEYFTLSCTITSKDRDVGVNFGDLDDVVNRFASFRSASKTLFWALFDPGHPEVVGCTRGVSRYAALIMWYGYNLIVVIILLNLLIAIMNATIQYVHINSLDAWKFQRTQVWMDYCNTNVTLPPPFNLIAILVTPFKRFMCIKCVCGKPEMILRHQRTMMEQSKCEYQKVIQDLISRYISEKFISHDK